eukprot:scaffold488930_cov34-Prasinocladus_malaysianus.AAC.1
MADRCSMSELENKVDQPLPSAAWSLFIDKPAFNAKGPIKCRQLPSLVSLEFTTGGIQNHHEV